jgi:hypothetical protein
LGEFHDKINIYSNNIPQYLAVPHVMVASGDTNTKTPAPTFDLSLNPSSSPPLALPDLRTSQNERFAVKNIHILHKVPLQKMNMKK